MDKQTIFFTEYKTIRVVPKRFQLSRYASLYLCPWLYIEENVSVKFNC